MKEITHYFLKQVEKEKRRERKKGLCQICGSDHWKRDCPKKNKRDRDNDSVRKPSVSVNAVNDNNNCAFMVKELSDNEIGIEEEITDGSDFEKLEIATDEAVNVSKPSLIWIEVFDLGATTHISPYHDRFSIFKAILS